MHPLTYVRSWSKSEQPLEDPLNSSNIDDYQACTRLFTADTRAEIWDINLPGSQSKVLDDDALRSSLDHYVRWLNLSSELPCGTRLTHNTDLLLG